MEKGAMKMLRKAKGVKSGEAFSNGKKAFPIAMATLLVASPFLSVPKAYAITDVEIDADDDTAGEESDYTITFTNEEDLKSGDKITIYFDDEFEIDEDLDKNDVDVDDSTPKKAEFDDSDNSIVITLDDSYDADSKIEISLTGVITNPDDADDYKIEVETDTDEESETGSIEITDDDDDDDDNSSDDEFDVSIGDDEEDKKTTYELGKIDLGSDRLKEGKWVTVTFPDDSMVPDDIDTEDVEINSYEVDDIEINDDEVELKVPDDADGDKTLTIEFLKGAGITNPSKDDDYTIKVEYDGETYESESFDITGSSSSSSSSGSGSSSSSGSTSLSVSPSDNTTGARTSYTIEGDFGSKKLKSNSQIKLEFPSSVSIPSILSTSDFTINGKTPKSVSGYGNILYLTSPDSFSATSDVTVKISTDAWISNPKTAGSYTISATVDGKTVTSSSYTVTSGSTTTPTPTTPTPTPTPKPSTPANNSTATIALTNTALQKPTGLTINLKSLAQPVQKGVDFLEVVFPAGYKLPGAVLPSAVTVNGVASSYVGIRGQNLLIYPAQDLPAATAATIVINASANIINPATKNAYSIGMYSSEERNLLFARSVGVGGAVVPAAPKPTPAAPTITYNPALPANAVVIKPNVPSFMLQGKLYSLAPTTYLANNSISMVSPQFFKQGLSLATLWNSSSVSILGNGKNIMLTVGSNVAVMGSTSITLPAKVELKNGTPMIPVKAVAEALGFKIGWDAKNSNAYIYK